MNNLWCTNYSSVRTNTRFTVFKRQVSRTKIMLFKRSSVKATERFCFPNKFELSNMTEFCDTFIMFHLRRLENSLPHKTLVQEDRPSSIKSIHQLWTYSGYKIFNHQFCIISAMDLFRKKKTDPSSFTRIYQP